MAELAPISRNDAASWITVRDVAELLGVSEDAVTARCRLSWGPGGLARQELVTAGRKAQWLIDRRADRRLSRCPDAETRADRTKAKLLEQGYPEDLIEQAHRKFHVLNDWEQRRRAIRAAGLDAEGIARRVVEEYRERWPDLKLSVRTLQRWRELYWSVGADGTILGIEGLIDQRHRGRTLAETDGSSETRSPEALAFFYDLYHTENKLSVKLCHSATLSKAQKEGWSWPESAASTARWLKKYDDLAKSCLMRHGKAAWSRRFMEFDEQAWDEVEPGSLFVADHKCCDFWVTDGREQFRPWLTVVQDCRSRCIVGWHLGKTPHQDAIIAAMHMAFRDWAIPEAMRVDNGKDFTSKLITGVTKDECRALKRQYGKDWQMAVRHDRDRVECNDPRWLGVLPELNVKIIYAIPYNPQSKGTLERWFGTFGNNCCKLFTTWCGIDAKSKPEGLQDIREGRGRARVNKALELVDDSDVPTVDAARGQIAAYIERYHNTPHRGVGVDGKTPLEVWDSATTLRRADTDALAFLMATRGVYKVGGNGVSITFNGKTLRYGKGHPGLRRYKGRGVLVAMNPDEIAIAWAFDADNRRLIGKLDMNERCHPAATGEQFREKIAETRRANKIADKARRESASRTRTMVQGVNHDLRRAERAATPPEPLISVAASGTGFEGASKQAQSTIKATSNEYDSITSEEINRAIMTQPGLDDGAELPSSEGGQESMWEMLRRAGETPEPQSAQRNAGEAPGELLRRAGEMPESKHPSRRKHA